MQTFAIYHLRHTRALAKFLFVFCETAVIQSGQITQKSHTIERLVQDKRRSQPESNNDSNSDSDSDSKPSQSNAMPSSFDLSWPLMSDCRTLYSLPSHLNLFIFPFC